MAAGTAPARAAEGLAGFRAAFDAFAARQSEPAWLARLRREAFARFEEEGLPTTRQEAWKYTNVAALAREPFVLAEASHGRAVDAEALERLVFGSAFRGHQVVVVNGHVARGLSSLGGHEGVHVQSLRQVVAQEDPAELLAPAGGPFTRLNTAFFEDGLLVTLAPGTVLEAPLHVVFFSTTGGARRSMSHPRLIVRAGRGSQLTLVESYGGCAGEAYFTNAVTQVELGEGAVADHYKVQRESEQAFHVASMEVRQGRDSRFSSHSIALGGALVRNDVHQAFGGPGGEAVLNGLFMAGGTQHTDTHTFIDHAHPHCASRETYRGILDGRARGVFHGMVMVRPGAQKTDAWQVNKNLLLSEQALVNSTPALEIYADDVRCKHGSTTGQLDPLQLFYLRSRGIGEAAARSLLIYAFASDLVSRIKVEPLRQGLETYLREHLPTVLDDIEEATV